MKNELLKKPASLAQGITLIEILLVLGLLTILLAAAMPSVSGAVSKAELESTLENVRFSVEAARKAARISEATVFMNISNSEQEAIQTITFSSPGKSGAGNLLLIQDFRLPAEIMLVSDQESYVFDKRGLVEKPGSILLVSRTDDSLTSSLEVK
jgi:type II secretory pathway pseudopilin PulG